MVSTESIKPEPMRIGVLAEKTGATVETIRYYEKEGLLPEPFRSQSNYRLYNDSHVERLNFILRCRTLDMTLEEVRTLLGYWDTPNKECSEVNNLLDKHILAVEQQIKQLNQLRQHLTELRKKCTTESLAESCGILNTLADNCEG